MKLRSVSLLLAAALLAAAGCGGGSGGSLSPPVARGASGAQMLLLQFGGTGTLAQSRQAKDFSGVTVTVFFNGTAVATGALNAAGSVNLSLPGVPPGATIIVVAGSKKASFAISASAPATVASITLNANGTITVTASASSSAASPAPSAEDNETEVEDANGNPIEVDDVNDGVLPANLPFTLSSNCTTITLTPAAGTTFARLIFEEKIEDGDSAPRFRYDGPFTAALTFPVIGASARIHIELFDATGKTMLEVKAPLNAFTLPSTGAAPSPCPSVAPTSLPSPSTSASPVPSPTPGR